MRDYSRYVYIRWPPAPEPPRLISEMAPPTPSGVAHLHAFYNSRNRRVDWKLRYRGSPVCKIEGRCRRVLIEVLSPDSGFLWKEKEREKKRGRTKS